MTPAGVELPRLFVGRPSLDVTVTVDPDGKVEVTIGDETGYNPELVDTMCRQARTTAIAAHRDLHPAEKETA